MNNFSKCILVSFSFITLTGSVFAQAATLNTWAETDAKRNGDYYKLVAPANYNGVIQTASNTAPQSWKETAAKRNGDYYKLAALIDYSNVTLSKDNQESLQYWEETAAKRNGDYFRLVAPTEQ